MSCLLSTGRPKEAVSEDGKLAALASLRENGIEKFDAMGGCCGKLREKAHHGKEKAKEKTGTGNTQPQTVKTPPGYYPFRGLSKSKALS